MDSAILNPNNQGLMGMMLASEMLIDKDRFCQNYTKAYRSGRINE
jgi:5-methyltetrahydrofolate--homocysteine methyltransferase